MVIMKFLISFCRVLVGVLFVISGMIKANDPLGFSYKMEEYFTVFKLTEQITDTTYVMRSLTEEEVQAVLAGTSKIKPTDYAGNLIDLTAEGVENEFMYTKEQQINQTSREKDHWFNKFCDFMHGHALELSVFISTIEIVLGMLLLAGYYAGFTGILLFLMILFFGFLTFYSAWFNKVTDCGCFGDALKLTPWQSFWKDVVLGIFILPVVFFAKRIDGREFNLTEKAVTAASIVLGFAASVLIFRWTLPGIFIAVFMGIRIAYHYLLRNEKLRYPIFTITGTAITLWFTAYCFNHLPVKDYRPWAIGNSVPQKMIGEPEFANIYMIYKNKASGEVKEYLAVKNTDGKPVNDFSWMTEEFLAQNEFVNQRKEIVKPYVEAPIHDFTLDNPETGESYAEEFIFKEGYKFMLVAYDLNKTDTKVQPAVNAFAAACEKENIPFIGVTASGDKLESFRHEHQNAFPYYTNDATSLKTIIRSNPGLVMMKDTVVVGKWHYNDFPTFEKVKSEKMK
jgi:hypothetical protein